MSWIKKPKHDRNRILAGCLATNRPKLYGKIIDQNVQKAVVEAKEGYILQNLENQLRYCVNKDSHNMESISQNPNRILSLKDVRPSPKVESRLSSRKGRNPLKKYD